jgi:hypothetical protein
MQARKLIFSLQPYVNQQKKKIVIIVKGKGPSKICMCQYVTQFPKSYKQ